MKKKHLETFQSSDMSTKETSSNVRSQSKRNIKNSKSEGKK